MLAHLAPRRLFSPQTRLAMSGPAILAAAAGMDALDEMFRAMADATLIASARAKASPGNQVWEAGMDVGAWLRETFATTGDPRARHAALAPRIAKEPAPAPEPVQRMELDRIYDGGYQAKEGGGLLYGQGKRGEAEGPSSAWWGANPSERRARGVSRSWRGSSWTRRPPASRSTSTAHRMRPGWTTSASCSPSSSQG
jgi:hypothetical protein